MLGSGFSGDSFWGGLNAPLQPEGRGLRTHLLTRHLRFQSSYIYQISTDDPTGQYNEFQIDPKCSVMNGASKGKFLATSIPTFSSAVQSVRNYPNQ